MTVQDKIEREIVINAPRGRVWDLVSEPGWWVGDGNEEGVVRTRRDEMVIVDHPKYGRRPVKVETVTPQSYLAYRWASEFPDVEPGEGTGTLVEFWLADHEGGTLLRVAESGFASLAKPEDEQRGAAERNGGGWDFELDLIATRAVKASV